MWFSDDVNTQELYNADQLDAWGRVRSAMFGMTTYKADYAATGRRLPEQVIVSGSETRDISFGAFDAVGREVSRIETIPNVGGTTTSTYDFLGRLGSRMRIAGGSTTQSWAFNYDPLGNITRLSDQLAGTHTTLQNSAIHSPADLDQVCAISWGGPLPLHCNVTHDSFGNMVSEPTPAGPTTLSYFNSGDVHTISNSAGVTATFAYDPFGGVQDVNIGSPSSPLRHDQHYGDFITRRSQTGQSQSASFISRQFPGPGLTISRRGSQGPWVFKFSEPQGTRFTTDENGQFLQDVSYSPYGASTSSGASEGSSTFTPDQWNDGDALDSFGLVQLGKRIYDPAIGRFLSRDPLMIPRTSATSNPYAFAMNDPLNLSDPSGMDPCSQFSQCSITAYGSYSDTTGEGIAALAFIAADYLFFGHAPAGMPMSSPSFPELALYNAAFDARLSGLQINDQFTNVYEPSTLQVIGGKFADAGAIAGGAVGFVAGAALCGTYIGCALGGPMMAASADVAGAHAYSLVTGDPAESVVGHYLGGRGQAIEEAGVAGFGLAAGVATPLHGPPPADLGGGAPGGGAEDAIAGFRAISRAEHEDILAHGFRPEPSGGSMESKWFVESKESAELFRANYPDLEEIIEARVPRDVYERSYRVQDIDRVGPGFCVDCADLPLLTLVSK